MSIADEQIAEIEALVIKAQQSKNEPWFSKHGLAYWMLEEDANYVSCASPEFVLALISRLRAAEMDAVRYRWLKDQGHFRAMSMDMGGNHSWIGMGRAIGKGPTVDEAIDAAIKTQT